MFFTSFYHCIIIVFIPVFFFKNTADYYNNQTIQFWDIGSTIFTLIVIITNIKLLFDIHRLTILILSSVIFSMILWIITLFFTSLFEKPFLENPSLFHVLNRLIITPVC